jgi:3-oxoacyl-[acyl-carrier protein] reductase
MNNSVIVVTGASRGLGLELASHYALENQVITLSRSKPPELKNAWHIECDLTDPNLISAAFDQIIEKYKRIDVLINNGAVLKTSPLVLMSDDDITNMVETNLLGTIFASKHAFRQMVKVRHGRIINILSMSHKMLVIGDSVYAATKSAIEVFSKILNKEGHRFNITVNNIGLSAMPSGMLDQIVADHPEKIKQIIPHGEYASLKSILNAIDYFCDDENRDIGGQTIYLGGV